MEPKSGKPRPRDAVFFTSSAPQPYFYSVGLEGSRFLAELRDSKRFLGLRCPRCRKVYVPPRRVCGPCFAKMEEWVEVGPLGTLAAFTILRFGFIDPETGAAKPVPYGYAYIRLDGADSNLQHFLKFDPARPPKLGMRVKPVFEDERHGTLRDVRHFEEA